MQPFKPTTRLIEKNKTDDDNIQTRAVLNIRFVFDQTLALFIQKFEQFEYEHCAIVPLYYLQHLCVSVHHIIHMQGTHLCYNRTSTAVLHFNFLTFFVCFSCLR